MFSFLHWAVDANAHDKAPHRSGEIVAIGDEKEASEGLATGMQMGHIARLDRRFLRGATTTPTAHTHSDILGNV
jgi:hypothetical protein